MLFVDFCKGSNRYSALENQLIIDESFDFESLNALIKKMIEDIISNESLQMTPDLARDKVEIYSAIRKSFDSNEIISLPIEGEYYEREFMVT